MTETTSARGSSLEAIEAGLQEFLEARTKMSWQPDVDLFASGVVSSLFAMELVVHVEKAFGVTVSGEDLTLANFRTVRAMTELVQRLQAGHGDG